MRELEIRNKNLVAIESVTVDRTLPLAERNADYRRQRKGNMTECTCLGWLIHEVHPNTGKTMVDCLIQILA